MFVQTSIFLLMAGVVIGGAINTVDVNLNATLVANTMSAPINTTAKHENATVVASNTTSAHSTTTVKPVNATAVPSNTTSAPSTTTKKPVNATTVPSNTTSAPSTTTVKPSNTTSAGNSTTAKPSNKTTTTTENPSKGGTYPHFHDVDPNTLSCDPDGHVFLLLPSFTDCSQFFMCAHGEEVQFNCAPGTVFDFVIQIDNDFLTADSAGTVRPVAGNAGKLYKGEINCQRADSASRRVAYKQDCQRYWRCEDGIPKMKYCADGLHFNEVTQQCEFEANVKCLVQSDEELNGEFIIYK
ncbi:hypothetical protein K1T71_014088 [Dendrolimus kikuchii]|uniref:Uncharacterized protein n=1 Tax=Dendrolimus kikuchii TaxID=765133 RepID=A0ACC1CEY3_9NEOP|nr:hypothetical protein K1T71_014088 [Dendrolimus kikuchii]